MKEFTERKDTPEYKAALEAFIKVKEQEARYKKALERYEELHEKYSRIYTIYADKMRYLDAQIALF